MNDKVSMDGLTGHVLFQMVFIRVSYPEFEKKDIVFDSSPIVMI